MQFSDKIWLLLFLLVVDVNAPVVECRGYYWKMAEDHEYSYYYVIVSLL